jgi:hypothetical protein
VIFNRLSPKRKTGKCQAGRPIRTGKLHISRCFHTQPMSSLSSRGLVRLATGKSYLGRGFPLRCFQRLSRPNMATQHYHWHDNWSTRGSSNSVLSY